jgi:hypothetical protein
MITILTGTPDDGATVAALWNAKRLDAASCWYQADAVDAAYAGQLIAAGFEMALAIENGVAVGFGFWCGPVEMPRLVALAADADEVYYRMLDAFCDWALLEGGQTAYAEISTAATTERSRMDALGVINYTPIGFEPLLPGQDPAQRVPRVLRAECELTVLKQAVAQMLEAPA